MADRMRKEPLQMPTGKLATCLGTGLRQEGERDMQKLTGLPMAGQVGHHGQALGLQRRGSRQAAGRQAGRHAAAGQRRTPSPVEFGRLFGRVAAPGADEEGIPGQAGLAALLRDAQDGQACRRRAFQGLFKQFLDNSTH